MLLIGITGSIGTGKSTTAKMFKDYNFGVYNADDTVHYIYENDTTVINKVEEAFPGTKENNRVNRKLLRDLLNEKPEGVTVAEIRIALNTTRKYVLPILNHLDEIGVTLRRDDVRIAGKKLK